MAKKVVKAAGVSSALSALASAFTVNSKVSGSCFIFSSQPMMCPLCRITVPANTEHRCERKG